MSVRNIRSRRPRRESPEVFERRTGKRLGAICLLVAAGYGLLLARLYHIQVRRHGEFVAEATARFTKTRRFPAVRGALLDRNDVILVDNQPGHTVVVDPNEWYTNNSRAAAAQDSPEERRQRVLQALAPHFTPEDLAELRTLVLPPTRPETRLRTYDIARWVPATLVAKLKTGPDGAVQSLPGVGFPPATRRAAINGNLAASVLGFTDSSGQGLAGIERSQNDQLQGQGGQLTFKTDARGLIPGTDRITSQMQPGQDVLLTLDGTIQHDTEQALVSAVRRNNAESGVAVVLDAKTGAVLAMASAPSYNINQPSDVEARERRNRTVEDIFEPGSTLKAITFAAALEENKASLDSHFYCTGQRKVDTVNTIHCAAHGAFQHGHGAQNLMGALQHSCNLATAECGARLGELTLYRYQRAFGFGQRTQCRLPGESAGIVRNPERKHWRPIELANRSFGQGISVTALQLAAAYTVFTDGQYRSPYLIRGYRDPKTGKETPASHDSQPTRVISEETAKTMRQLLGAVVENGTGQLAQVPGYTIGGKTGTAQISEGRGYGGRFVASFVGLAPLHKPQFVILVAIRGPQGADHFGGSVAGPAFREIAEKALMLLRTPHDAPHKRNAPDQKQKHFSAAEA